MESGRNKKKSRSFFQSKAYLATVGFVLFLTFAMALSALIVGPIALEKADDANDDINGASATFESVLYQAGPAGHKASSNITIEFKSIGDMNYATLIAFSINNVNTSMFNSFFTGSLIPSNFIPKSPDGEFTNTIASVYYGVGSSPPTILSGTGSWTISSNGTVGMMLSTAAQYVTTASSTMVYPKS
jgi:hypothetical protein